MLKTKDRHHTTSRAECQAGRRKIFAIFVPGVLAEMDRGLKGTVAGRIVPLPREAVASDGKRRLGRDALGRGADDRAADLARGLFGTASPLR